MKKYILALAIFLWVFAFKASADGSFQVSTKSLPDGSTYNSYYAVINFVYSGLCQNLVIESATGLPAGITGTVTANYNGIDQLTLIGMPTVTGLFPVALTLSDQCGASSLQNFTLNISNGCPNAFTFPSVYLPDATAGFTYSYTINGTYCGGLIDMGQNPINYRFTGLPSDGRLTATVATKQGGPYFGTFTITLGGTPAVAGTVTFTAYLQGVFGSSNQTYQLRVLPNPNASVTPMSTPAPQPTPTPSPTPTAVQTAAQTASGTDNTGTNISSSGTVYMITANGQKRPYTSAGAFLSYGFNSWANVVPASSADLALPTGDFIPPRDGKIVCSDRGSDKGTCYLITDSKKAAFTSAAVFKGLGFSFTNALRGDVSFLPSAPNISSASQAHPAGVLVNKGGTIYLLGDNGLLGIPDMNTLASWGYSLADLVLANAADSAMVQTGVMATHIPGALSP